MHSVTVSGRQAPVIHLMRSNDHPDPSRTQAEGKELASQPRLAPLRHQFHAELSCTRIEMGCTRDLLVTCLQPLEPFIRCCCSSNLSVSPSVTQPVIERERDTLAPLLHAHSHSRWHDGTTIRKRERERERERLREQKVLVSRGKSSRC